MAESATGQAVVKPSLAKDMRKLFRRIGQLCPALGVSRPTWQRIYSDQHVKHGTATQVVQQFFALLMDVKAERDVPEGIFRPFGLLLFDKYQAEISALEFDDFVTAYAPPPKAVTVAAVNQA
jgi:hypothetical protein